MDPREKPGRVNREGHALLVVVILVVIVMITAFSLFALTSYETKGALYRQESSEAFYLADGAIERARAKFLEDETWRDGWTEVSEGNGTYDLALNDTTFQGYSDVLRLVASGTVGQAQRRIEVMGRMPASAFSLGMLIMGDATATGNLCLSGIAHVVGDADFGNHDVHLTCGGQYTSGFDLVPPSIYTEADYYPETSYYTVRGTLSDGVPQARIFDRYGADITEALGDSLVGVTLFDPITGQFTFKFNDDATLQWYFDEDTGVFRRAPGDVAVVVNFGAPPLLDPPGLNGINNLVVNGAPTTSLATTLINTRFTGVTEEQRVDPNYWIGGLTDVKQIIFEPTQGIAAITADFMKSGASHSQLGTEAWPALVYVTRDVVNVNSNFVLIGALTCLGNWNSTGGPTLTYDERFIDLLPAYLRDSWQGGVSGTLEILRWREIASSSP